MDDKNQDTNEYTGEYGNAVERAASDYAGADEESEGDAGAASQEQNSSVYSYSYREHQPEATRSGDYRASEHDYAAQSEESSQNGEEEAGQTDTASQWHAAGETTSESREWQRAETGTQNYGQQPSYGQEKPRTGESDKKERGALTGKKIAACAGLAVLFGVVAAICFQAVCYFSGRVLGVNLAPGNVPLAYTTDNVKYTNAATNMAIGTADVSGIAQQTMPSMVSITSTAQEEGGYDLFGQYYQGQDTVSAGTGFVVGKNDTELLIATNNHVVNGAKAISVQFIDEEVYEATTKGRDSSADLAVIAVKLKDIKKSTMQSIRVAALGDSSECRVGEMVIAIGNSLGYGQSVTVGYVSAKDREISTESENGNGQGNKMKVIQTDAAINPGNSGGPLLDMNGRVIGITSAKIAASSVEGVGYSIPISEATPIIDELMNREVLTDAQKGYLGITGKTVTEEASNFNMPEGVYVDEVAEDGAAGKAGIKKGDIITAINDIKVTSIESLREKANSYKKGTKVTITLQRSNNGSYKEKKLEVELQGESSLNDLEDGSSSSSPSDDKSRQPDDGSGDNDSQGDEDGLWDGWGGLFPGFGY